MVSKLNESRSYAGKTADQCYSAAETALPEAGFRIWKKRPVGWLVMGRMEGPEGLVEATLAARPGAAVTLALAGERASDEALKALSVRIFAALEAELESVR